MALVALCIFLAKIARADSMNDLTKPSLFSMEADFEKLQVEEATCSKEHADIPLKAEQQLKCLESEKKENDAELMEYFAELQKELDEKVALIRELKDSIREMKDSIREKEDLNREKEDSIRELEDSIREMKDLNREKEDSIREKEDLIQKTEEEFEQWRQEAAEFMRKEFNYEVRYKIWNLNKSVTIHKDNSLALYTDLIGSIPLIGGSVYAGGKELARYLDDTCVDDPWIRGKKVLDFGSGTGYVGLVAAFLGGDVTVTDLPAMVPLMEKNIAANLKEIEESGGKIRAQALRWGDSEAMKSLPKQDVILMSDVIYHDGSVEPLVSTVVALSNKGTKLVVSNMISGVDSFWNAFYSHLTKFFKLSCISQNNLDPEDDELWLCVGTYSG